MRRTVFLYLHFFVVVFFVFLWDLCRYIYHTWIVWVQESPFDVFVGDEILVGSTMRDGPLELCFQFLVPKLKKWLAQDVFSLFGKFMSSNFRFFSLSLYNLYRFHCGCSWWVCTDRYLWYVWPQTCIDYAKEPNLPWKSKEWVGFGSKIHLFVILQIVLNFELWE